MRTTTDPGELAGLHAACREGRLYDAEDWIRRGHPLQLTVGANVNGRRFASALEIALDQGSHSLVLLLLCNGYDANREMRNPLDLALRRRRWDLLNWLLAAGADPKRVDLDALFESYNLELIERFYGLGVELTRGHALAAALGYHSSNKPLFGFAKRHRGQDARIASELNIALGHHVSEGNEKGTLLCLWAGADPHVPAPCLRFLNDRWDEDDEPEEEEDEEDRGSTAIEEACWKGDAKILDRLGIDPARDDLDSLFRSASSAEVVTSLARFGLPRNVAEVIRSGLWRTSFRTSSAEYTLRAIFKIGVRWMSATPEQMSDIRRTLLRISEGAFVDMMRLLAEGDNCSPEMLKELGRTPSMRKRMVEVGFIPGKDDWHSRLYRPAPTRAREVRAKFGIQLPKPPPSPLPRVVQIGPWRPHGREIRLDRAELFARVWSEPVDTLARTWGLSGRGLAKACRRLDIPVPPRGFWARQQSGQRVPKPRLPAQRPGVAEEIVIRAPA